MFDGLFPLEDPGAVFAVLFLIVLLGPLAAERARLPAIIGLVVAGMVIGPNVLGVLDQNTFIETLGYVGLLYLMFQGGLDLDLDGFAKRRRDSLVFGVATLVLPMVIVTGVCLWLEIDLLAAIIIGSAFTSHTLLSYQAVDRYDLTRNRAVTATLGATLICTVAALLILAVAAAAASGDVGPIFWIAFLLGLTGYLALMLIGVPRFTRWFFTGLGQDRQIRLTFLLSGMGLAAVLAGAVGIEPIVGAFLAGLAFNRFVPLGTIIEDRVRVLGRSVFIPAFLISTGMILDPVSLVADPRTLVLGGAFVVAEVVSKWLAADISGRIMGVSGPERGLMFSLSVGQAAGALAAVIVADDLGLIGEAEVNAVVLVILVSALIAGVTADRYAPMVEAPDRSDVPLGNRVVVPVSNPRSVRQLVRVAAQVAAPDSGAVVAVNVLPFDARPDQLKTHRKLAETAEKVALAAGSEVTTSVRIDSSTAGGVLHTVVEQGGSCLVMGWKGYANAREGLFGSIIDQCVSQAPVPVLVCRPGTEESTERVVVVVTEDELDPGAQLGAKLAFEVGARMAAQAEVDLIVLTEVPASSLRPAMAGWSIGDAANAEIVSVEGVIGRLNRILEPGDVVITGVPPTTSRLGKGARRLARAAGDRTVVVAVPH
ncbi:MAG: cation:proton antiporter [Nitriliruptoraceae bacterium]|nr:cation:proton antiporter [Nitriliruptoraceae bacterium]